jgi:hypothetical protein
MTGTQNTDNSLQLSSNFDDLFLTEEKQVEGQDGNILPEPPKSITDDILTPPVIEPKEEVAPTPKQKSEAKYREKIKELIEDNLIEDFTVTTKDENGVETEVFVSELKSIDKTLYKTLIEGYNEAKKNSINEKYISREGLDENTTKIIEVAKAGGSLAEAISPNIRAVEQISDIKDRLNNAEPNEALQTAINIVAQDLQRKGLSDRIIQAQIKDYVDNIEIDSVANQILDAHLESHKEEIEFKRQEQLTKVADEKEKQKKFRDSLISEYKDLGLPDTTRKVLVDNATIQDSERITNTDKLYFESIGNPKKYALINYALNNLEEFQNFISHKKVFANKAQNLKSILTVNLSSTKTKTPVITTENAVDEMFAVFEK